MVKLGGRDISIDQGINLAIGASAAIDGAACIFAPDKSKNFVVGTTIGSTKSMTRLGGSVLLNMGVNSLLHGLDSSTTRNKQGLGVNAAALGVASIICFNEWKNGGDVPVIASSSLPLPLELLLLAWPFVQVPSQAAAQLHLCKLQPALLSNRIVLPPHEESRVLEPPCHSS